MESKASSKSIMLNYGLVLGIVSVIISLSSYALGMHLERDWKFSLLGFVAMVVIIVMGIKKFKHDNGTFLSFGQAVKIGIGISIISALITIIYNQIFINVIEPDFMNQMLEQQKVLWEEADMSSEQMEGAEQMFHMFSGPVISSAIGIVAAAFFGFVISAIAGAIMKKSEESGY